MIVLARAGVGTSRGTVSTVPAHCAGRRSRVCAAPAAHPAAGCGTSFPRRSPRRRCKAASSDAVFHARGLERVVEVAVPGAVDTGPAEPRAGPGRRADASAVALGRAEQQTHQPVVNRRKRDKTLGTASACGDNRCSVNHRQPSRAAPGTTRWSESSVPTRSRSGRRRLTNLSGQLLAFPARSNRRCCSCSPARSR